LGAGFAGGRGIFTGGKYPNRGADHRGGDVKSGLPRVYSSQQLARRVRSMGSAISRDYKGRTVDVVILFENAFVFAADLVRKIAPRVVCHFVRVEMRDLQFSGHDRREIYFSRPPLLENRDVLLVDAVIKSGLTQDFLMQRLHEDRPRSLRLAVLFDKAADRRVNLRPDYFGFAAASKYLAGYGLAGTRGGYGNLPYVGVQSGRPPGRAARRAGRARTK
jgi:hypoxanthine phosphoribosyltransferase